MTCGEFVCLMGHPCAWHSPPHPLRKDCTVSGGLHRAAISLVLIIRRQRQTCSCQIMLLFCFKRMFSHLTLRSLLMSKVIYIFKNIGTYSFNQECSIFLYFKTTYWIQAYLNSKDHFLASSLKKADIKLALELFFHTYCPKRSGFKAQTLYSS